MALRGRLAAETESERMDAMKVREGSKRRKRMVVGGGERGDERLALSSLRSLEQRVAG